MTGLELKIARIRAGVKQLQLSKAAGIHITRLSMIENGWKDLHEDELARVETALGIGADGEQAEQPNDMNSVIRRAAGLGESNGNGNTADK